MTNKRNLLLASAMLCAAMGYAQRTPTHPLDIKDTNFSDILANLGLGNRAISPLV